MEEISKAIEILNQGGIVIFPTDTAYGIGCRIDKEDSVKRLFKIRKRPEEQAVPVLINGIGMANDYFQTFPKEVESLMEKYWPGRLTIVYRAKKEKVAELVRGGGENVGLRMPSNSIILSLIDLTGVPILGPSANFHGEKTPFKKEDLDKNLIKLVDFVIDEEPGGLGVSTVLDCTKNPWEVLRQGSVEV